jgi:membrane protein
MWKRYQNFLLHDLWEVEAVGLLRRRLYPVLRVILVMGQELAGGQLTLRAMSLVYTTLLSLVPLLAVSFSVLKAFGVHNQIEPMLLTYLEPLGSRGEEITMHILSFVDNMKVGVLGAVGVGLLIYTVISLTQKVESSFNFVWRVSRTRSLPRRFSDYLSVIMVGPVLVVAALGMTASLTSSTLVQMMLSVPVVGTLIALAGKAIPFLLIIAAFTFVYVFVPNTKVRVRSALVGALISGILWQATGYGFATFVASSTKYTAVYSGLAILMFFMIWLYLSWFILLFGAQISYFHQHPQQVRLQREAFRFSSRLKERAGLMLLYLITDAYMQGRPRWTQDALVQRMGLPGDAVADLLHALEQHGLLAETGEEHGTWLLARDPEYIPLSDVLDVLRSAEESVHHVRPHALDLEPVDRLIDRLQQARNDALAGKTLKDLVTGR